MLEVILAGTLMAFIHIRGDVSSKEAINQTSKQVDFTVDLIWRGLLRVAPISAGIVGRI